MDGIVGYFAVLEGRMLEEILGVVAEIEQDCDDVVPLGFAKDLVGLFDGIEVVVDEEGRMYWCSLAFAFSWMISNRIVLGVVACCNNHFSPLILRFSPQDVF